MNDELKLIAIASREAMEGFAKEYHIAGGDPKDLLGYCAISSYLLCLVARKFGYRLTLVEGVAFDEYDSDYINHCWVQYKKIIIDITATQFGCSNKVHITNTFDKDYNAVTRATKTRKNLRHYWHNQSPYEYIKELQSLADEVANKIAA